MKILGFMSLYYGGDFYKESLLSIIDSVDIMHIVYTQKPSQGFSTTLINPDKEFQLKKIAEEVCRNKLIWETYSHFTSENEHRNVRYKHSVGFRYILTIDADEIFENISEAVSFAENNKERFFGIKGYKHFFHSFKYFYEDDNRPIRLEKLISDNKNQNLNCPLNVYHTSMLQDKEIIMFKFSVFGHKNEIKKNYLDKYFSFDPIKDEGVSMHPTTEIWTKPIPYTGDLPKSLKNHVKQEKQKTKVLFIPMDFHRHPEDPNLFQDMIDGLLTQGPCEIYTDMQSAVDFKPTVILYQASLSLEECLRLKELTGALFCMYTGDATAVPPKSFMDYKSVADLFLVPFGGKTLELYKALLGKPCHFLWEPIQNWRFVPNRSVDNQRVVFVGNYYSHLPGGASRLNLLAIKSFWSDLSIYGTGWGGKIEDVPIPYEKVPALYNESYAVICENNYSDVEDYFTPRNLGAMAAGSCALMKWFPGIEKFFQNLTHCIYYKDKYELLAWINFLRENPGLRDHIADYGFKLANERFTCKHWAQDFMSIIKTHYIK